MFNRKILGNILTKFLQHSTMSTCEVLLNGKQLS